jgi:hypothetical protein
MHTVITALANGCMGMIQRQILLFARVGAREVGEGDFPTLSILQA